MFDSMIKEILAQVGGLTSQNTELCALLRNILQVKNIGRIFTMSVLPSFLMHPWYAYFEVFFCFIIFFLCSVLYFRRWCRQLMLCPLVYATFAHLRRRLIWLWFAHYQLMFWGFWKKPFGTARWVQEDVEKGFAFFSPILQQRLLFSSFILPRPFITWADEKTHIVFVLRRVRWCTVAVCPWWLTCCRAFLRMLTASRRVSWSCSRKCPSTAVPQKKRSLILSQVQDFACSFVLSAFASLLSYLFLKCLFHFLPVVIHSLLDICFIISNLDMALHANTWKFLIRYAWLKLLITLGSFNCLPDQAEASCMNTCIFIIAN